MKKPTLGIDYDEVLVDTLPVFLEFYAKQTGEIYTKDQIWGFDLSKVVGRSEEFIGELFLEFYKTTEFRDLSPMHGSQEAIRELSSIYDLHVVTSRPNVADTTSKYWLEKNHPDISLPIHYSCEMYPNSKDTKPAICKSLDVVALIDDNLDYALSCVEVGIRTYLFKTPWNKNAEKHDLIVPVSSWSEIPGKLNLKP